MRSITIIGILLILAGIASFAFDGIPYTTQEEVVEIGPLKATAEQEKSFPLPPVVGGVAIAGGFALVIGGLKRSGGN
jgi:hypothetical protein